MTTTTKKATTARKTTARKTTARKTATVKTDDVVFTNVKDIAEHYFLTAKNVRRLLRQNFARNAEMKNAIYKFDAKESEAIKEFFDAKYKSKEEETK